jgi:hypothetical protein
MAQAFFIRLVWRSSDAAGDFRPPLSSLRPIKGDWSGAAIRTPLPTEHHLLGLVEPTVTSFSFISSPLKVLTIPAMSPSWVS